MEDDELDWGPVSADETIDWDAVVTNGELDLEARNSLRRVAGLSTDLEEDYDVEYRQLRLEKVVLVGVWATGSEADAENAMTELAALAQTAGSQVLEALIQRRKQIDPATFIGRGKVDEVRDVVRAQGADTVICDGELTSAQLRNLEDRIGVKVVDRTALILDIFAQHARSTEGKAQVELAQLQYLKQRLRGWGKSLSRQVGGRSASGVGIGGRGPGETKIETDRRRITTRIAILRRKLRAMDSTRALARADRDRNQVPSVAIVGYTNAGKSSLLNRLTGAGVLVEDALFATLDPTTRRVKAPDGRVYTLTDTVGFVRHLPHDLVEAFRSTLEESARADLLVQVVDASDVDPFAQIDAVHEVLRDIKAGDIPELLIVNKTDLVSADVLEDLRLRLSDAFFISAATGAGVDALREAIEERLPQPNTLIDVVVPYSRGDLLDRVHRNGEIISQEHTGEGTRLVARVNSDLAGELAQLS
jgi:GTP-binding protein HflX